MENHFNNRCAIQVLKHLHAGAQRPILALCTEVHILCQRANPPRRRIMTDFGGRHSPRSNVDCGRPDNWVLQFAIPASKSEAAMPSPVVLYAGTMNGIARYEAVEQGRWRRVQHTLAGVSVRAIVGVGADTLLVAADGYAALESFDGGRTWVETRDKPPQPHGLQAVTIHGPVALANPRLRGATAYARLQGASPTLLGAGAGGMLLFRSDDEGIHWEPAQIEAASDGTIATIVPDAGTHDAAWTATSAGFILRSGDRGRTWQIVAREPAAIMCLLSVLAE
jgi:hypothetical protein